MVNLIRHAVIDNGVVVNIVDYDEIKNGPVDGIIGIAVASDSAQIGYSYANGAFTAPAIIAPIALPVTIVSMRQARAALITQGLLSQVESALAAMTGIDGDLARNTWNYAMTVRRDNTLLISLSNQLGMTSAQLDSLFSLAATL